jgi:uncharacterized protein YggU (UPF0235/DUF167 family)
VTPRAAEDKITGFVRTAQGSIELIIQVTAPSEDGKSNAAVIKLLARAWKVPKSSLSVTKGSTDGRKVILVIGHAAALGGELMQWLVQMET